MHDDDTAGSVRASVALLQRSGAALAARAAATGPDAPVPTCPGWSVRDLVAHVGTVHRWAERIVRTSASGPLEADALPPGDDELVDWFLDGHASLVTMLGSAPADAACWTFLPAPTPLAFWSRRQAHETTVHAIDAGAAADQPVHLGTADAVDGLDELLTGFVPRPTSALRLDPTRTLGFVATDADATWVVTAGSGAPSVTRGCEVGSVDCVVRAPSAELYRLVWNRRTAAGLHVEGDPSLLARWRKLVQVRWR